MSRLASVSYEQALRAFRRLGFQEIRTKGSHVLLRRETERGRQQTVLPKHKELKPGTLRGALELAGVSQAEFLRALKKSRE